MTDVNTTLPVIRGGPDGPHLTVCYITNRLDPKFQWFADSFHRETGGDYRNIKLVAVDYWSDFDDRRAEDYFQARAHCEIKVTPVHPNVWCGKYMITAEPYFSASATRNTGIMHAPDGYIAFVDDLSVLMPGWLNAVRRAMAGNWIACGAYRKVNKLVVERGEVKDFEDNPHGWDSRWQGGKPIDPQPCGGGWMYGCSIAAPVESFLIINGFDTDVDGMSGEDYIAGNMLAKAGFHLKYCRAMLTFESEELHHKEPPFRRIIKPYIPGISRFSEKDASHAIIGFLNRGRISAPNYYGTGGLRSVRNRVLAGEPMPIIQCPEHMWCDGQPIKGLSRKNDGCP